MARVLFTALYSSTFIVHACQKRLQCSFYKRELEDRGRRFCELGLTFRRREGVPDEPGWQRLPRHADDGSQWASVYELDRRPELTRQVAARDRGGV